MANAEIHFITGKGGVGKSTLAAAMALDLSERGDGPVLLIEIQGSGRSLKLLGLRAPQFQNTALPSTHNAWGARVLPRETFKQYFGLLLALGNEDSAFSQATSMVRNRLVDMVLDNKVVSAFVDVCPGLEPAVLLGKIHWEASQGHTPEGDHPWKHVVVDAPSTGHGVMLLRSTFALIEVFGTGLIFKQATKIKKFIQDPALTKFHIVTTPEELPMEEAVEVAQKLAELGLKPHQFIINRCPPPNSHGNDQPNTALSPEWQREISLQKEFWCDQEELIQGFQSRISGMKAALVKIPDSPGIKIENELPQMGALLRNRS